MNNKIMAAAAVAALGAVCTLPAQAQATNYGTPSGRWFEAIVAHETGHCLGWWEHRTPTSSSIMRASLNPYRINAGTNTYRPTSADLSAMQASRSGSGSRPTTYVQYPRVSDSVPLYNRTGRAAAFTAADRWDPGTDFNIVPASSEPTDGITIKFDSSRAGTSVGGWVTVEKWAWSGTFWQPADCTVHVNTRVVT